MEEEVSGNSDPVPTAYPITNSVDRHASRCICCLSRRLIPTPAVLMPFLAKRIFNHEPVEITAEWGLRDLRLGMAYSLCNTLECGECGAIFLDYRFSDQELAALYKDYRGPEYTALRSSLEPGYNITASHYQGRASYIDAVEFFLSPHLPSRPKVLDWGGDSGINTPFRFRASSLHVYDISGVDVCSEARKVDYVECLESSYDLIVCSQVLEHVSFPIVLLQQIVSLIRLQPQTLLYLEVPLENVFQVDCGSKTRGSLKRHWHEHINFFSPSSLMALAKICGLEVIDSNIMHFSLGWKQEAAIQMLICKILPSETISG